MLIPCTCHRKYFSSGVHHAFQSTIHFLILFKFKSKSINHYWLLKSLALWIMDMALYVNLCINGGIDAEINVNLRVVIR